METTDLTQPGAWAAHYATLREALLARITEALSQDERFPAAWLFGSFGRGEHDTYSDLDLTILVASEHVAALCGSPWRSAGRTTPERWALVARFGTPLSVNEVHANAPDGGAHTNVIYADGARLDLNLVPVSGAIRPLDTHLLWDRLGIPVTPAPEPETLEERRRIAGQQMALFWIMVEICNKYRLRGWGVMVQPILAQLTGQLENVRRLIAGQPPHYSRPATRTPLAATSAAQRDALYALAIQMEALIPAVRALGEDVRDAPWPALRLWPDAESDATIAG